MKIFEPVKLGDLELTNRIAMAPMTRGRAGDTRVPNAIMAEHYEQRASAGLLISEATCKVILPSSYSRFQYANYTCMILRHRVRGPCTYPYSL